MDFMKMGTELLGSSLQGIDSKDLSSALGQLLSGSDGKLDLGNIVSKMNQQGLGSMVESWLGDGGNTDISADQVKDLLGSDKISQVASQLNTGEGDLLSSLTAALPQLMDKSSSGGSLLDSLGGMDGALNMASKFFK